MRAVDTNLLVRLIARDDSRQTAAAEAFIEKGAWVSHIVLIEAMWVLSAVYDRKPAEIGAAVEMLLNHTSLAIQEPDTVIAALEHLSKKPALGFSDCMLLEVARKAGHLPLGTFDRVFGKLPGVQAL